MGQQITRRDMIKGCLAAAAAGAMDSVPTTVRAAAPDPAAMDYDAVILGAGTAGLVAAVEACNQGIKPVVLEKMDLPAGNSIYAMGALCACGTRVQNREGVIESKDDLFADMMKISVDQQSTRSFRVSNRLRNSVQIKPASIVFPRPTSSATNNPLLGDSRKFKTGLNW